VISDVQSGHACRDVAAYYGISISVVRKWLLRFHRTGSSVAKPMGGARYSRLSNQRDWILATIAARPGLTLAGLHGELSARGIRAGYRTLERFLKVEKLELPKSVSDA
jgi:transposase